MEDEKSRHDNLKRNSPGLGSGAVGQGLNGVRGDAAATNHPYAMQNPGEGGGGGDASNAEPDAESDIWGTISNLAKQKRHADVLAACNKALKTDPNDEKILERKVRTLCQMGRFHRAFDLASQWLDKSPEEDSDDEEVADVTSGATSSPSLMRKVDNVPSKPVPRNTVRVLPPQPPQSQNSKQKRNNEEPKHFCPFCDISFERQEELDTHCHSDLHKKRLASDESHKWNYRPPPRGQTAEDYVLCQRFFETQRCPLGDKCTHAHSDAELDEWRERFAFRKQQLQQARDKQLHGNTFIEQLLEKLTHPDGPQARLVQNLDFVKIHVNSDLKVNMTTKKCTNAWTFTITSKMCLHAVGLLDDANRSYFHISSISVGPKKTQKYQNLETHCQEWTNQDTASKGQGEYVYRVKIVFKTDIYGTFRQQVVLGLGLDTVVVRDVQVESCPATDPEKLSKDLELSAAGRWTADSVAVVPFLPPFSTQTDQEEQLLKKYILPRPERLSLSETLMQSLSKDNYRLWMHEMLYLEEMAELGFVQRFNVTGDLQLVNRFLLMPGALSSAKYTREGELFARLKLEDVLSEDSSAGRLILQNAQTAWVAPAGSGDNDDGSSKPKTQVYEAQIEDKGKTFIFLRLSADCVSDLNLTCDVEFHAQIQFQLNRLPKCEMHSAVDSLPTLNIVFPSVKNIPPLPPPLEKVLSAVEEMRLNEQQREAILTITSPVGTKQPPLLIIGPFGTGKTYTLAQAAKLVLEQEDTRILICTHSNSAADLYIKDFLHPYVEDGHVEARPLRVYYRHRWVHTIPEVIIPYSLWSGERQMFCVPTEEDVKKHRVIITTLSTARYISDIGLPPGFFTHIFIDEAAQALECETLIPLGMADEQTRIVLAGDHLQISPEVYSDYTRQQGFHISFLERLYDLYPRESSGMVMLCENYRSHKAIVDFTSELFYDQRLVASGKQSPHSTFYPLSFCHAKGIEEQHENSTGFYNLSEVYEIVDRVEELRRKWPEEWGNMENNGVSVVAPYHDQVVRIRNELRKKKIYNISVERVLNVQGKQYRVIIISTVRTRNSCRSDSSAEEEYLDYGFLSNVKLLNTAITRAQSLVMVVGDPLSLCLVGKCRKVWEYFLETCHQNKSLFGITWTELRASLDRVEVAKNYVLNPMAPEFIPNRRYHMTLQVQETNTSAAQPHGATWPYLVNQHPAVIQPSPYQLVHPQMMPYYGMPMYSPYIGPVFMRAPGGGGGMRLGHHHRLPRPGMHPGAHRGEGVRMADASHTLRSPGRFHQRGRLPVYQLPRMPLPLHYPLPQVHPMYTPQIHPGYHMMPEDPRVASLHAPFPYSAAYHPQQLLQLRGPITGPHSHLHGPHFHQGLPLHAHPTHAASPSPQGRGGTPSNDDSQDSGSSPEAGRSSSSSVTGGFQVLPNVKHVPPHLMRGGLQPSSQSSSRSSTPINPERGPIPVPSYLNEGRRTPVSDRPYSPANYAARSSPLSEAHRDRSGSRERDFGASESADLGNPFAASGAGNSPSGESSPPESKVPPLVSSRKTNNPKQLRLKTGFSRQFSDDLPTPTAITDIVRMIEENIEEGSENSDSSASSPVMPQRTQLMTRLNGRNAALSSLQLDLVAAQRQQQNAMMGGSNNTSHSTPSSSDSPATMNGERPTYAGIVGKPHVQGQGLMPDISQVEPQTPRTPTGFTTPGSDPQLDPYGILKGLNIEATSVGRRLNRQDSEAFP
ncbi:probable helicase with zinc finger domain isoform X2 [Littorina saxatilis]|uniref:probable helicase with zinc finger domain isoform X2 n=1 Tax=Littorina saxatilis TaxID=31220 RepID=UPI0038B6882D